MPEPIAPINREEVNIPPEEYNDLPDGHKQAIREIAETCRDVLFVQKQYDQQTRIEVRTQTKVIDPDILNIICSAGCTVEYVGEIREGGWTFGEVIFDANTS